MGKAVPKNIKSKANALLKAYPDEFKGDFIQNKQELAKLGIPLAKEQRNLVAGFITRKVSKAKAS